MNSIPDPHLLDFLLLASRHRILIVLLIVGCGIGSFALTYWLPQEFSTKAVILAPDRLSSSGMLKALNAKGALKILKEVENPSVDYAQNILESRTLAEQVMRDSAIAAYYRKYIAPIGQTESSVQWLQDVIKIEPGGTELYVRSTLSTSWNPGNAEKEATQKIVARISNYYVELLNKYFSESLADLSRESQQYVVKELQEQKGQLDSLDRAMVAFQSKNNTVSLDEQVSAAIDRQAGLESELATLRYRQRLESIDLSAEALPQTDLRNRMSAIESELTKMKAGIGTFPAMSDVPRQQAELQSLKLKIKTLEPIVLFLGQELEQVRINEERRSTLVQMLDPAEVPQRKSAPHRATYLFLGLTVGFALSVGYLAVRSLGEALRVHTVVRPEEVTLNSLRLETTV